VDRDPRHDPLTGPVHRRARWAVCPRPGPGRQTGLAAEVSSRLVRTKARLSRGRRPLLLAPVGTSPGITLDTAAEQA
jgi:hypothetical protein